MRRHLGEQPADIPLLDLREAVEKGVQQLDERLGLGAGHDFQLAQLAFAVQRELHRVLDGGVILDAQRAADAEHAVRPLRLHLKRLEAAQHRDQRIKDILAALFRGNQRDIFRQHLVDQVGPAGPKRVGCAVDLRHHIVAEHQAVYAFAHLFSAPSFPWFLKLL